jgi:hypothetical protein
MTATSLYLFYIVSIGHDPTNSPLVHKASEFSRTMRLRLLSLFDLQLSDQDFYRMQQVRLADAVTLAQV